MSSEKERKLKALTINGLEPPGLMIRILRYANGWTAKKLLAEMEKIKVKSPKKEPKLAASHITEYETGKVLPGEIALKKLCGAFRVSPSFLFISEKTHPETINYLAKPLLK